MDELNLKDTENGSKPKEKLEKLGPEALTDRELIMALMDYGCTTSCENDAKRILDILNSSPTLKKDMMMKLGKSAWIRLSAAIELGRRKLDGKSKPISSPKDIYREVMHYASNKQEHFIVVMLNGAQEKIGSFVATVGTLNRSIIHPREVFAPAIENRAAAIAIAHNHPSGNLLPSEEDIATTDKLVMSGKILGIKVIDHIIFSDESFFSFMEHSLI